MGIEPTAEDFAAFAEVMERIEQLPKTVLPLLTTIAHSSAGGRNGPEWHSAAVT